MTFTTTTRLKKLSESEHYDVASDSHDIRDWAVVDADGTETGRVLDLLFDTDTEQVRYVIVDTAGRHVLIPLGVLGFEEEPRRVVAVGYAEVRLAELPLFLPGIVTPEIERDYYLASVPDFKENDPIDYGVPVFQGALPKRAEAKMSDTVI